MRQIATAFTLCLIFTCAARAESPDDSLPDAPQAQTQSQSAVTVRSLPKNFLKDQKAIWTSPLHIRSNNAIIPIALVAATAVTITTDHQVMSEEVSRDPKFNHDAVTISNGMLGAVVAWPAALFVAGSFRHDEHATETGILSGEAIADGLVVSEVIKIISRRERPTVDDARGKFFQPNVGFDSSFASNHAFIAWSAASVVATEYHGPLTMIAAYGLAAGVSVTRVLGQQHFPSDVLVGSACGWLIGRYVVHHRRRTY
jgi:membrane-associated phospholipid phosphatase